jgi:hypothetical protein
MRWLALLVALSGCGAPLRATGVTLVSVGAPVEIAELAGAPIDPSVELRPVDAPSVAAPPHDVALAAALADARAAYLETLDFATCLELLAPPGLVHDALARSDREPAARVITMRAACHLAAGDEGAAEREADRLAVLGLPIPDLADAISPRAEAMLADAVARVTDVPGVTIEVRSDPAGASVGLDGRAAGCTTPCRLEVAPGEHFVVLALDAHEDGRAVVHTDAPAVVATLTPSGAERAAQQWAERHAGAPDSWPSLRLLQVALRDRRILLVTGAQAPEGWLLRVALSVDAEVPRRLERLVGPDDPAEGARAALRDLLSEAGLIPPRPILEEPLFWTGLGLAAAIAAGIAVGVLYQPSITHPVRARGEIP